MYKVLLVDDDEIARMVCKNMESWNKMGFEIAFEASNGEEALKILDEEHIDVVFTDIRMPLMDGIALLRAIRNRNINVFVVLISLYKEFDYAKEGLKFGAVDYIIKPIKSKELDETLTNVKVCLSEINVLNDYKLIIDEIFSQFDLKDSFMERLYEFLSRGPENIDNMEVVADRLGFSKGYFGKNVKTKTGCSYNKLVTNIKMQYSKTFLAKSGMKVYEVSEMLGYADADYFTHIFKREFGITPADYRKNLDF